MMNNIFDFLCKNLIASAVGIAMLELASKSYLNHHSPTGSICTVFVPEVQPVSNMIARPTEVAALSRLIRNQYAKQYFIVVGGSNGKTTLICQVLNPDNIPKSTTEAAPDKTYDTRGCVYIEVHPTATNITTNDGDTFGIQNQKRGIFSNVIYSIARYFSNSVPKTTQLNLETVLKVIEKAARAYRNLYGKIPILVIDHIDVLATCSPAYLSMLQKQAKSWADKSILTVVFVVSDRAALSPMKKDNSAFSRAREFEVEGVSNEDARRYLEALGYGPELVEKVVQNLTGGNLILLNDIKHESGSSYEEIEEKIFSRVRVAVWNLRNTPADDIAVKVINTILESENQRISTE